MLRLSSVFLALSLVLPMAHQAMAAEPEVSQGIDLPSYYPESFQMKGVVNRVEVRRHYLVISGQKMSFDPNIKVHTLATEHASLYALRVGDPIGLNFLDGDRRQRILSEIWVLPPGSVSED